MSRLHSVRGADLLIANLQALPSVETLVVTSYLLTNREEPAESEANWGCVQKCSARVVGMERVL